MSTNGNSSNTTSTASSNGEVAVAASASAMTASSAPQTGIERLSELESLFRVGPESAHESKTFSTETLLDVLLVLFNECANSSLRKEKTVTDFIELGKTRILLL